MRRAVTRYASNGAAKIAYQVIGHGSLDLVLLPGFPSNLDILWEDPDYTRLVRRLSTFCRLILFDPRGTGLSDAADPHAPPDLAMRAADIGAVMDAAGCGRAALLGASDGVSAALLFAATHPQRLRALILYGGHAGLGPVAAEARRSRGAGEAAEAGWGSGATLARFAPGRAGDPAFAEWWGRLERLAASPTAALAHLRGNTGLDLRAVLPAVAVPILVLHRTEDAHADVRRGRELARRLKGARLVELPGRDHPLWLGDVDRIAALVEEFLTGERSVAQGNRALAMLLVARVVGTARGLPVAAAGRHLQERLELFRDAVPRLVGRYGGRAQWSGSDRLDACFNGAARAVGAAVALRETAASFGLALAQGLHAGDIDTTLDSLSGRVLETASRIAASTQKTDILLSRLASELVSGAGMQFADRGTLSDDAGQPFAIVGLTAERHLEPLKPERAGRVDLGILSPREREVLGLVADGLSNPSIAVQLGLSEHTVKRHVANILVKLAIPTRAAAAALMGRQSA